MTILFGVWRFWHGHCGLWGISVIPLNCRKGVWVVVHSWCCVDSVVHSVCALIVIFQCCILVYCWPYHVGHSREGLNATVIEYGRHAGIHHTLYAKLFCILHFCAVTFFSFASWYKAIHTSLASVLLCVLTFNVNWLLFAVLYFVFTELYLICFPMLVLVTE